MKNKVNSITFILDLSFSSISSIIEELGLFTSLSSTAPIKQKTKNKLFQERFSSS